jgi:hypothetical protein
MAPPAQINHGIKLYPHGSTVANTLTDTTTPVVAEFYDEVVFTDPIESFYSQLLRLGSLPLITSYSQQAHFTSFTDTEDAAALVEAQKFLQQELAVVKERLLLVDQDMQQVDEDLRHVKELPPPSRKQDVAARRVAVPGPPRPSGPLAGPPPAKKAKTTAPTGN